VVETCGQDVAVCNCPYPSRFELAENVVSLHCVGFSADGLGSDAVNPQCIADVLGVFNARAEYQPGFAVSSVMNDLADDGRVDFRPVNRCG